MTEYRVAIVGVGFDPEHKDKDGFAMGYRHAEGYDRLPNCDVVACADLVAANAERFAERFDVDERGVFTDHEAMLSAVEPDVVSVCVPAHAHADIVRSCLAAGVQAVHCEKPMAATWSGARGMAEAAHRRDVQLTFNHQRRLGEVTRRTKALLEDGAIGELRRIETNPYNLFDYGSHSLDLASHYNDDRPAEWILAALDYRTEQRWFGAHCENQSVALWAFENGVTGLSTADSGRLDMRLGDWHHRLVGDEGVIESGLTIYGDYDGPLIRLRQDGGWTPIECEEGPHNTVDLPKAIAHVIECLDTGEEPLLSARRARIATELIFGGYESVRRRGRVDFPLEIEDNPLEAMVEDGTLDPAPTSPNDE